jgi:hypothetical protein
MPEEIYVIWDEHGDMLIAAERPEGLRNGDITIFKRVGVLKEKRTYVRIDQK